MSDEEGIPLDLELACPINVSEQLMEKCVLVGVRVAGGGGVSHAVFLEIRTSEQGLLKGGDVLYKLGGEYILPRLVDEISAESLVLDCMGGHYSLEVTMES